MPSKPCGKQQDQPGELLPFVLRAGDELVNDDLGGVDEVAELGFPQHQPVGAVEAVAVLEAQRAGFGEGAVEDFHGGLIGRKVLQRDVRIAFLLVVERGMTLAERAAGGVLAGEPDAHAFGGQRSQGQGFGG